MIDSARLSGLWLSEPSAFPSPPPPPPTDNRDAPRAGRDGRSRWSFAAGQRRWRPAATAAATAVAVTLIGIVAYTQLGPSNQAGVAPDVVRPLQGALETASSMGLTVIPGGESGLAGRSSRYRSGTGEPHGVLNQSIVRLEQSLEDDPQNRDVTYWLAAAYIATGQKDLARDFTREARSTFARDADIATLYALVLYRDGDITGADRELRRALTIEPRHAVAALNLGIVLFESGEAGEARQILERVARDHSDEPIGERARAILSGQNGD